MNTPMRRVMVLVVVLFVALLANLTRVQFFKHDDYRADPNNRRVITEEYSHPRGTILAGGEVVAESVEVGGDLAYERRYPLGDQYGNITGWKSLIYPSDRGIELFENDVLSGNDDRMWWERFKAMFTGEQIAGGNVLLTIDPDVQAAAYEALQGQEGAIVVTDPQTGAILAQVTSPSYDPSPLASHEDGVPQEAWSEYTTDDSNPMRDRGTDDLYPPGSTFKTLVSAIALESGMTPDSMVPAGNEYVPPNAGQPIRNSDDQCPQSQLTLREAFAKSCNTTFAKLCVEEFSADQVTDIAARFGYGEEYSTPLESAASQTGDMSDPAFLAQSCIGQHSVVSTVLQSTVMSAAIANDGSRMEPQLIQELQYSDQTSMSRLNPDELDEPVSADVAAGLRDLMEAVVSPGGTGSSDAGAQLQGDGYSFGGKTGTADHTDENGNPLPPHTWFTGWAVDDSGDESVAITVFLDSSGNSHDNAGTAAEIMSVALGK